MANKQRSQIYEDVVQLLKKGSYTTLQIAENTGINWETAKNAVETLTRINLLSSYEENGKTYYTVNEANFLQLRKDTLLGLPLNPKQDETTRALLSGIKQRWQEIVGKPISKTFLQKILVRLVEENKIQNVPYGWYLFGECAVLYTTEEDITPTKKYDKEIDVIVKDYAKIANTNELLQTYYTRKGNQLYLHRLNISNILMEPFKADSLTSLKKTVRDFLFTFPKTEDNKEIVENLNAFASMIFRLVNHKNEKEMEDLRSLLNDTFSSLWESMATYNLFHSLQDKGWYDEATLQRYYRLRTQIVQEIVENYFNVLNDQTPNLEIPKNDPINKFKGTLA